MRSTSRWAWLLVAGCALPPHGTSNLDLNFYGRRYCSYAESGRSIAVSTSASWRSEPAQALQAIMCARVPDDDYHRGVYEHLDPAHPDPLLVSLMIVDCVGAGHCGVFNGTARGPRAGVTADYARFARTLDPDAVRAELAPLSSPDSVKDAFMLRLAASCEHLVRAAESLSPRLHAVFTETIDRTLTDLEALRAQTAAHQQAYAALRPEIDASLVNEGFTSDLHARVRAERDAYVHDCVQGGTQSAALCANGEIGRPLTEYLARSAAGLGRDAEALAEQEVLRLLPDVRDERVAIRLAVGEAMRRETRLHEQYAAAVSRMTDTDPAERQRLLAEQFGPEPPVDMSDWSNAVGLAPPETARGVVRSVRARVVSGLVSRSRVVDARDVQLLVQDARSSSAPARYLVPRSEGERIEQGQRVQLALGEDARASVIRAWTTADDDADLVQIRAVRLR